MKQYKLELTESDLNVLSELIAVIEDIAPKERRVLKKVQKQIKTYSPIR